MRTVQMTLDDDLVEAVDQIAEQLHTSRSAFAREALGAAIERHRQRRLEEQHRRGYEDHPATAEEFGVWEAEQEWGDP